MKIVDFAIGGKEGFLAAYFATHLAKRIGLAYGRAVEMWSEYGNGYIYTPTGMVLQDCERNRERGLHVWGKIIIVTEEGRMMVWTNGVARKIRKREKSAKRAEAIQQSRIAIETERREYIAKREREEMFEACSGKRCPKRQGQARGVEHCGKYVTRYFPTMDKIPAYHNKAILRNIVC